VGEAYVALWDFLLRELGIAEGVAAERPPYRSVLRRETA